MTRGSYGLFIFYLFIVAVSWPAHGYTQPPHHSNYITGLSYSPMANNNQLSVAKDSLGYTWVRGYIPPALRGVPLVFQIPSVRMLNYELYLKLDGNWTRQQRNTSSEAKHFRSRFPQYAVNTTDSTYYLALDHPPAKALQVQLAEHSQFASSEASQLLRSGLYYGLALMSLVFNFVFYLIFKDKRFSSYCVLLSATFLSFFYEDGMFYYISDGYWTMEYFPAWSANIAAIVSLIFTYHFLGLKNISKRAIRAFFIASGLLLFSVLAYTLTDNATLGIAVQIQCFPLAMASLYLAIRRFRKDVYARFLVISFSLVVISGLLYVMYSRVDADTFAFFNADTFRLVSSIEIICISFAIIFKMRSLQHENERYRVELNNYLRVLEVKATNQTLYTPVAAITSKDELATELKKQYNLTDREAEVLRFLWNGLTNKEIADQLYISVSTAKYHVRNLYVKLEVKNRNQVQALGTNPGSVLQ